MSVILKITMLKNKIFRVVCLLLLVHTYAATTFSYAKGPSDSTGTGVMFVSANSKASGPAKSKLGAFLSNRSLIDTTFSKLPVGLGLNDIKITGTVRFLTIYRDMQKSYRDMITSPKNVAFSDYPIVGAGTSNNGGFPMLELNFANSPLAKFQFNVGYSLANNFTGNQKDTAFSKILSSRNNLRFSGKWNTGPVRAGIDAGALIWTKLSRLTMGQTNYRDNYFDRVPWDWYRNSFSRYDDYYSLSSNIGAESAGRSPLQGWVANTEILPLNTNVKLLYGRTNLNTIIANSLNSFPSQTYGGRIEHIIFKRKIAGSVGLNYYKKDADLSWGDRIKDNQEIVSIDAAMKVRKINFSSEFGHGKVTNPLSDNKTGNAFVIKGELDRKVTAFPVSLEYYHINYNYVSLDGSVMNSNTSVRGGGFGNSYIYDNMMLINVAQQVGQIANNRQGFSLKSESNIKKLKIQVGWSGSQELQNLSDTVTFQHRVNSFSASRFRPWYQAGGEYGRIKSVWLTTYETVTITDPLKNYKKGFSNLELFLKYKLKLFKRDLVILNFNTYNSIQKNRIAPVFTDNAFVRLFFEDLTFAYRLGKKYNLVANWGLERAVGNNQTQLAPNGKGINQIGHAYGAGIDYDFMPNAGLHFRIKYMNHNDRNFVLDQYRGYESTVELKIWF
jgi:hypothetical protein